MREYTRALTHDPRHFRALFNRGFAYDKLGKLDLAIKDYSLAIEVSEETVVMPIGRSKLCLCIL